MRATDPEIATDEVRLRRLDGVVCAYAAWPAHTLANVPSVVVIMDLWGVDAAIREIVRRFAKAGIAAIAPDLYARFGAPSGDGVTDADTFRPFAKRLDRKQYDGDIRAAALWLTTKFPQTRVGIAGLSMGGTLALVQALDNGDVFAAVAPFYGAIKDIDPDKIHVPVCGSYGARDTAISAEDVRLFRSQLCVPSDIRIYNTAGHAFMDETRDSYVAAAATDAWARTVAFFKEHLEQKR
ncbi:MAG TPA: dienelactone hydrolase family protein [Verrucomicrobiae bacterium]|nr:dienelactone hydrolase family protein [Verrucomicrobiae bacterium]